MYTPRSISNEILAVLFLTSVLTLAVWGIFDYVNGVSLARQELRTDLISKTNRLSYSLVYPVWNLNQEEIEQSIAIETGQDSLIAILLHREDGKLLAGKIRSHQEQFTPYKDSEAERQIIASAYAVESKSVIKNNAHIGTVYVYVSDGPMKKNLRTRLAYIVLQLLTLSVAISFSIYLALKKRIIRPINALENSVRSISPENFSPEFLYRRDDEIGRLFESFAQMSRAVKESFTSQKQLTDVLRKREEQIRAITSNVPGAIYRMAGDCDHTMLYVSERIEAITGIPAAVFIGNSRDRFRSMVLPEDREILNKAERTAIEQGSPLDIKFRISDSDGRLRWIHEIGQGSSVGDEFFLDGVMIDDTELHEKDVQLMQSQKMETVGVLAGGIAHDFNNILAGIMGAVSMLKIKLPDMPADTRSNIDRYITLVEKSSFRAADMTRQLLSLSKPQDVKKTQVDLCTSLRHIVEICRGSFDKSVSLATDFDVEAANVNADPVQIEQVLLNLCVNAAHAVTIMRPSSASWGGDVRLSLKRIPASEEFRKIHKQADEVDYWEVGVSDTGVGMDEKNLLNVFTPFYTTKQKGAGSGLGLSMAYTIISQHNGFITTQTELGKGSTFRLYLPVLEGNFRKIGTIETESGVSRGEGTVLVVDDEELLRENAKEILTECGYSVLSAQNGEEAVRLVEQHGDRLRLIILDMVMPVLSGRDAYYRIREISPGIRILLSSGNSQDERVEELLAAGVDGFIGKPYTMEALADKVHSLLQSDSRA